MPGMPSYFDRYNLVKQIPIFSKLNWFELQKIARFCHVAEYKKGDVICRRDDPSDYLYCVVSGRIQAYVEDDAGRKTNVEFLHRGMYFGIISLLTGEGHSLNFQAINDSVVLRISQSDFQAILQAIPQLGVAFSRSLSQRLRRKASGPKTIFENTIISVYSPVPASGASTYAVNLALNLRQETGKKVALLNIVSTRKKTAMPVPGVEGCTLKWKKPPVPLEDIIGDDDKILSRVERGGGIPIERLYVQFDPDNQELRKRISQFVTALVNDYHYIVVDLPNAMDDIVFETLTQSDMIHLVVTDSADQIRMTRQVLDRLETSLKEDFRVDKVLVLLSGSKASLSRLQDINKELDYDIYARLEFIDPGHLTTVLEAEDMSLKVPDPGSPYAGMIRKVSRRIGNVLVGLVLGGGAALGLAHIGVLKVLEEENIPVDVVVGSSMGALIGGLWAGGYSAAQIAGMAAEFQRGLNFLKLLDPVFPVSGFIGGRAIRRWLTQKLGKRTFYETRIPLKIVAYALLRRQELVIDSGSIVDAIHKSVAIPGVIKPILEKDKVIIDGGVLNPLPINVLTGLEVNKIIAVNVLQSPEDVVQGYMIEQRKVSADLSVRFLKDPGLFLMSRANKLRKNIFSPSISDIIVYSLQASEYVIAEESSRHADVMIHPDLVGFNWFELNRSREFIKKGEEAARKELMAIRHLAVH